MRGGLRSEKENVRTKKENGRKTKDVLHTEFRPNLPTKPAGT